MPDPQSPTILWFRQDLRLTDHPALTAALAQGGPVLPLFILEDGAEGHRPWGGASRWWLNQSLCALAQSIEARGGRLILRRGAARDGLERLVEETGAKAVYWNRRYDPAGVATDTAVKAALAARGVEARSFSASLLAEPWTLQTGAGEPFKVFSPFARAARAAGIAPQPQPAPSHIAPVSVRPASEPLESWGLHPRTPDWSAGLQAAWRPGEAGAQALLDVFVAGALAGYAENRNRLDLPGTSRLSPHLHWGEISPGAVWAAAQAAHEAGVGAPKDLQSFHNELLWREFSHHLLYHYPNLPTQNWRAQFDALPWRADTAALRAWRRGRTGFPAVDAGMRELWATGFMHNRARMIVASFLIKHLLIDWRHGEAWFWDTLVDANHANNAASWQWVAGSGADAAPYFRIFNPVMQGQKFDLTGAYVRRWVPELARLPDAWLHQPWEAPHAVLQQAGVRLGATYPAPIIAHDAARVRALAAFESTKAVNPS